MKLTVEREKFVKALQKVINITGNRSTLPVLGNVLMVAQNGELTLTTTDLETRITTRMSAEIESDGETTMPVKKLHALASKFIATELKINCDENNHMQLSCGTSQFKLLGLPAFDFPKAVEFSLLRQLKFKQSDCKRMLSQISYAVSIEDSRKVLHGILCSVRDSSATLVATDGKRLALAEKMAEELSGNDGDSIVPLKAVLETRRLLDGDEAITLELGERQARFVTDSFELSTKLIEGTYPNYRQVIPSSFSKTVVVNTNAFLQKIELVSQALSDNNSFIIFTFEDNKLELQASSTEYGEGRDYMEIEYRDERIEVSFNPLFIADPLRNISDETVSIKINDSFSQVAIEGGEGFLYVIMPMRR